MIKTLLFVSIVGAAMLFIDQHMTGNRNRFDLAVAAVTVAVLTVAAYLTK